MPASQDIVTQMLSSSACSLLMDVKETLQTMQNELCSTAFNKLWQKYAKMADSRIYNKVGTYSISDCVDKVGTH